MPITVIDSYSAELTANLAPLYAPLKPNQYEGRIRVAYFTKTFASEAAGHDVALCVLPKNARIISGSFWVSASTGSATLAIGLKGRDESGFIDAAGLVSDNTAFFLAAAAVTVLTEQRFANTIALNAGYELEKECYVTLVTAAAAMTTQSLRGFILYVVD